MLIQIGDLPMLVQMDEIHTKRTRDYYRMLENTELLELVNDHMANPELAVVLAERLEDLLNNWDYDPRGED
jgi:hypothetical protein